MATANSTYFKLWTGATPVAVACATNVDWEIQSDLRETSCKDTDGWRTYLPGMRGGSVNVEGNLDYTAGSTSNPKLFFDAIYNRTSLTVKIGSGTSTEPKKTGTCYVENYSESGQGIEENVTYSATLRFSGAITWATEP